MTVEDLSYKDKKVISIGIVSEPDGSVGQADPLLRRTQADLSAALYKRHAQIFLCWRRTADGNRKQAGRRCSDRRNPQRYAQKRTKAKKRPAGSERKCSKASLTLILNTKTVKKTNHSLRFIPFKSPGIRHNLNQIYFLVYPVIKSQAIRKDTTKKVKKWSKINLRGHSTSPASSAYKCMSWIQKETPISLNLRMLLT